MNLPPLPPLPAPGWTPWQPVPSLSLSPPLLAETLNGGQAFRWHRLPASPVAPTVWLGQWAEHLAALHASPDRTVHWSAPAPSAPATANALPSYLGLDSAQCPEDLPWRSDPHLAACLAAFPGLRLLRQPFGETLLGFICSATKQIVQIKQMLALLASRLGPPHPASPDPSFHLLPSWPALAFVSEEQLRDCRLGFRARHVAGVARFLAAHPGWLEATEAAPYPAAKARLMELPGVGEKIADCVLLFGAGRLEAFPVDVWIIRAMAHRYGLDTWSPTQIAHFGRVHFGPQAGLAQQYLFAYERAHPST